MGRSAVRYATTADGLEIAYQVLGDGPIDVVIVPGLTSNVDRNADFPIYLVVGSGLEFDERGERELRGVDGRWRLLALRG
jgi:hypothetical protein